MKLHDFIFLIFQDLLLAFIRTIDYREHFGLHDDLTAFIQFIKKNDGLLDHRINTEFNGKKTHYASAIPLMYFELEMRK